ncbi:MAG: carboxypeptidase family protein, partial [Chlorobi bacterium]|nr:carboxypeptidase family protein [Chlorobiota bacterium]
MISFRMPAIVALLVLGMGAVSAQDKCFDFDNVPGEPGRISLPAWQWDYTWQELESDVARWSLDPLVDLSVIGRSVQQRPLYLLTITASGDASSRRRVWIHARTHPIESEGSFVMREIVDELLSGSPLADSLLSRCVFQALPMLNPDGVVAGNARTNARGVDLESNWYASPSEPEVEALRAHFTRVMQETNPIEVALNLHSSYRCKRYFVYHAAAGTSEAYTKLEQRFIALARARFPGGIEPYTYFVSWTTGTPSRYPESWFWINFKEAVLALTYEDMNCEAHGEYDKTARALLGAIGEYLGVPVPVAEAPPAVARGRGIQLEQNFPNPFGPSSFGGAPETRIIFRNTGRRPEAVRITVHDLLGRRMAMVWEG